MAEICIGGAPASWGIFWPHNRELFAPEVYAAQLRDAGYRYTELGPLGYFPTEPAQLRDFLDRHDLRLCGAAHVHTLSDSSSYGVLEDKTRTICSLLQQSSARYFVLMDESEHYPNLAAQRLEPEDWAGLVRDVRRVGELVSQEYGLSFLFHSHIGTAVQTKNEIERLLEAVPAEQMGLCFDTAHYAFWEDDTLEALKAWRDRIPYIHLKNLNMGIARQTRAGGLSTEEAFAQGVMQSLGEGDLDIAEIVGYLRGSQYSGYLVIEEDYVPAKPQTPFELARQNRAYLAELLG